MKEPRQAWPAPPSGRSAFAASLVERRRLRVPAIRYPEDLPVSARAGEIRDLIQQHPVVVIAGETGSGKTTQLPKICLEAGFGVRGMIGCTQPRRVAALSVSRRIAEELRVEWGREVGAKIRFTDKTGPETLIKILTDGMLLSEIQGDPLLSDYEVIIVDEAHERSLNIDFLLGYLVRLREWRPDLRILITSATIDTAAFAKAFGGAPIVEVSGRMYPVDVTYAPVDELLEETGEVTYIEAAARAVEEVVAEGGPGDVLVFLPSERDIRETRDLLEGRLGARAELIMLFGRLSNADQEKIFKPFQRRKVILATNIAETSLTIPGIRTVIDSGLARISRYNASAHTQRLPIEKIARSSAEQRRGRAGRVGPGHCIRLYPENDYAARPQYTTPEIQRANLAAVILRMVSLKMGRVEDFPFIDPPHPRAIRAGYQLLRDLGALDDREELTPLGRDLARLPCDPTIGRMLLQANREGALREVLVIAAALSIQDPRERPAEQSAEADQMHRKFVNAESDFLTLLNIWKAYHDETERLSQAQMRRFCRSHFLNYMRMREWRDIHQQLSRVLEDSRDFRLNTDDAEYHAIHRSLLSGLLMNIAERAENNHYKGCKNRSGMVFPGSGLFDKSARARAKKKKGAAAPTPSAKSPSWVFCAEWVETARLYLRTVARMEVRWVLDLGRHLLQRSYSEPWYEENGERVLAKERTRLYGLEVEVKAMGYVRVDPVAATDIFIREALIEGRLRTQLPFHEANGDVMRRLAERQTRLRRAAAFSLEERLYAFYAARLKGVGSVADLSRFLRTAGDDALRVKESDLVDTEEDAGDTESFPEVIELEGIRLPVQYRYEPGEEADGATLRVPVDQLDRVGAELLDWAVPGYIEERIETLLRALPKEIRRSLFPIPDKVKILARAIDPKEGGFLESLTRLIEREFSLRIPPQAWDLSAIPGHLQTRVEIVDTRDQVVASGRDWEKVRRQYRQIVEGQAARGEGNERLHVWREACARHERPHVTPETFPELPVSIEAGRLAGVPVLAFPGLQPGENGKIALRLFTTEAAARMASVAGVRALQEMAFGRDLAWLERDLDKELKRVALIAIGITRGKTPLFEEARAHMLEALFGGQTIFPLSAKAFAASVAGAKERSRGWVPRFVDLLHQVLTLRLKWARAEEPILRETVARLFAPGFLRTTPPGWLPHYPRFLAAAEKRAERARRDPRKDAARAAEIRALEAQAAKADPSKLAAAEWPWLLEELRVSHFAQELGTSRKVSVKRLEDVLQLAR
jgi:ATP-dependent helicase HrpA